MGPKSGDDPTAEPLGTSLDDADVSGSVTETTVPIDDLFDVLARPSNRFVLTYLLESEATVYIHDIVDYIIDVTEPPEGVSESEYRGQINARLLHASLPKLEDVGLIEYEERRQRIAETDETASALPYLRFAHLQQSDDQE